MIAELSISILEGSILMTMCMLMKGRLLMCLLTKNIPFSTELPTYSGVENPRYEIDKEKIEALTLSFKRHYPDTYRKLSTRDIRGEKTNLFRGIPEI